jgi:hypothetical protein
MDLVPPTYPERFPCPCCGYQVFSMAPGSHQVCPVCGWEDDLAQLRFVRLPGSANQVSLEDAQANYERFGVAELKNRGTTREPLEQEPREPSWRPVDAARDNIEEPARGVRYGDSYPLEDTTVLYYWRPSYWRRLSS